MTESILIIDDDPSVVTSLALLLKQRGVAFSGAALGTMLAAEAVSAAPVGLAAGIASSAFAGAAMGTGTTLTVLRFMTMSKLKLSLVGALALAGLALPLALLPQNRHADKNLPDVSLRTWCLR